MIYKIFVSLLIVATTHFFLGCVVYKDGKEFDIIKLEGKDTKINLVVMPDGNVHSFKKNSAGVIHRAAGISGTTKEGLIQFSPLDDIKEAYIFDPPEILTADTLIANPNIIFSGIKLKNETKIDFNEDRGRYLPDHLLIRGVTDADKYIEIKADDVLYLVVEKVDMVMSFAATIGVLAGSLAVAVLIALASKKSCPFIYSFDGDKYVFDAEPLGGAISKAFERTDYNKLKSLKEIDGEYKLKITNEVFETEYIDEMSLFVVDHPENTTVTMNNDGSVFALGGGEIIDYANDEEGRDIKPFLIENDFLAWQTKMPFHDQNRKKHKIKFGFKMKEGAKKATLVYNVGTTHWGSTMLSEMLELHGKNLDEHYSNLDKKGEYYNFTMDFLRRAELYDLELKLKINGEFKTQAVLQGGGPFKTESRVVELDISGIKGDMVEFEVNPPVGFWTLDNFTLCFDKPQQAFGKEIKVSKTIDHNGNDISEKISFSDENYYDMPTTGDWFFATYKAPPKKDGMKRTVFMKTKGWYKIQMPQTDKDSDIATIFKLIGNPGEIIKFSNERYRLWIQNATK
ncbi:hypothetical protein MASR2M39_19220 [Ignavibacteriales bacterium]